MSTVYQRKIRGFVSSNNQEMIESFVSEFTATTEKFEDIKIYVVHDGINIPEHPKFIGYQQPKEVFGNIAEAPILRDLLNEKLEVFLYLNDDVWFVNGWLEDMINKLDEGYLMVSGGIADTDDRDFFNKCVEETEDDIGTEDFIYLPCAASPISLYKRIGLPDKYYPGCMDDMDWIWRIFINKIPYCALRRIRIAHLNGGGTRGKNLKTKYEKDMALRAWYNKFRVVRQYFYEKHGYEAFKMVKKYMKNNGYYKKFRYLKNES